MAHLSVRFIKGVVRFYLDERHVTDGARLELKERHRWLPGRFHTRLSPVGAELVVATWDSKQPDPFVRLSEESILRWRE